MPSSTAAVRLTRGTAAAAAAAASHGTAFAAFLRPRLVTAGCSPWWGAGHAPLPLTRPFLLSFSSSFSTNTSPRRIATAATDYNANTRLYGSPCPLRHHPTLLARLLVIPSPRRHLASSSPSLPHNTRNDSNKSSTRRAAAAASASAGAAPASAAPLPIPLSGPNGPKLKVVYSAAEDKARRAPPPDPPKGTWKHYRNWLFRLTGPDYDEKTPWTWFKWHLIRFVRIFIVIGFTLANLVVFAFGCVTVYAEQQEPTPKVFTNWARTTLQIIYWYQHINGDLPLAGLWGRDLMNTLEKQMEKLGGWEKTTIEWKRAYAETSFKIAKLFEIVAKDEDAYVLYRRIIAIEPEVVDAKHRSQAYLAMGGFVENLDEGTELLQQAVKYALEATATASTTTTDANQRFASIDITKPVLPESKKDDTPPTPELLAAVQALGIQYSRLNKPAESLPIFLALLRALQVLPESRRDTCREASIMAYIGEVIWAVGSKSDGLAWTKKAMGQAEKEAERRNSCKECAIYAVANAITMTEEMEAERGRKKGAEDFERELSALRSWQERLSVLPRWDVD
ncbi:hypothetical protein ABW20_dc0102598 [Dactylellina cionopaga]|nr:hypothetical protein ABW20_dc0102598 [Dactylellina cionopaga]